MDIIMTASGCNTAMGRNLIKDAIYRNYKSRDIRQMTIGMICFEGPVVENVYRKAAEDIGFGEVVIVNRDFDITKIDKHMNAWYIGEGNTFTLRYEIVKRHLEGAIKTSDLVIGSSAGAVICTSSIEVALDFDENSIGLQRMEGLNIVPTIDNERMTVVPHYNMEEYINWRKNTPQQMLDSFDDILYLPNNQYIFISEDNPGMIIRGELREDY